MVGQAPWPLTQTAEPTENSQDVDLLGSQRDYMYGSSNMWPTPSEGWGVLRWNNGAAELPVHVLRMMQWSMMGLQLTVISKQWCALWCWADLSSGLNCRRRIEQKISSSEFNYLCTWTNMATFLMNAPLLETLMKLSWTGRKRLSHPDSHVSNIGIFWAFHEHKSWISGVFNDDFFCYFSRSCRVTRKVQLKSLHAQDKGTEKKQNKTYQLLSL